MLKLLLTTLMFIFCLLWAEVKVEKVLETTSIKEYNQWVKKNKARYPGLKPIYVTARVVERMKVSGYKYKIHYYNEEGEKKHMEEVSGLVFVKVSPYFNAVGIFRSNTTIPSYMWPARSIIKNQDGKIILDTQKVYLAFVSPYLYLTVPSSGESSPLYPTVEVFSATNESWVNTLRDCWLLNGRDVAHSFNFNFTVVSIEVDWRCNSQHLILLDSKGNERWRKTFVDDPEKFGGINVAIAPDASTIVVNKDEKIIIYDSIGNLREEYTLANICPSECGISDKGKYLLVATRHRLTKYDNETKQEIWRKDILEGAPMKAVLSKDGKFGLIQFHPNVVYLIDRDGNILKQWDLETEIHHPTAPSGKKIKIIHPVQARLEFHDDIAVVIHDLNGEIFIKIWRMKEE